MKDVFIQCIWSYLTGHYCQAHDQFLHTVLIATDTTDYQPSDTESIQPVPLAAAGTTWHHRPTPPPPPLPCQLSHHLTSSHPRLQNWHFSCKLFFFSKKLFIIIHPVTTHTKKNIKNIYNHSGDVRYPDLSEIPTFTTSKNSSSSTPHTAVWQCCTAGQYSVRTEVQLEPVRSSTVPSCRWSLSPTCNQSCTVCWICS